jgi:hypothetical protein
MHLLKWAILSNPTKHPAATCVLTTAPQCTSAAARAAAPRRLGSGPIAAGPGQQQHQHTNAALQASGGRAARAALQPTLLQHPRLAWRARFNSTSSRRGCWGQQSQQQQQQEEESRGPAATRSWLRLRHCRSTVCWRGSCSRRMVRARATVQGCVQHKKHSVGRRVSCQELCRVQLKAPAPKPSRRLPCDVGFRSTRRTKLVCTIGPASCSYEVLSNLADRGMNVARLNMTHGSHAWHERVVAAIRRLNHEKGCVCARRVRSVFAGMWAVLCCTATHCTRPPC